MYLPYFLFETHVFLFMSKPSGGNTDGVVLYPPAPSQPVTAETRTYLEPFTSSTYMHAVDLKPLIAKPCARSTTDPVLQMPNSAVNEDPGLSQANQVPTLGNI